MVKTGIEVEKEKKKDRKSRKEEERKLASRNNSPVSTVEPDLALGLVAALSQSP